MNSLVAYRLTHYKAISTPDLFIAYITSSHAFTVGHAFTFVFIQVLFNIFLLGKILDLLLYILIYLILKWLHLWHIDGYILILLLCYRWVYINIIIDWDS